jgi:ligand-binding SRPBCC domain-containing protein
VIFESRFRVRAPLAEVVEFHRHAAALKAISPPFPPLQILAAPDPLEAGATMTLRFWLGPIPLRWRAALEDLPGDVGFRDRMVEGPFAEWCHEHRFVGAGERETWIEDRIEARLPAAPLRALLALGLWAGLRPMFLYRAWRTRRLLERA